MPCRDYDADRENNLAHERAKIACDALTIVEKMGKLSSLTKQSQDWWERHKEQDRIEARRKRIAEQQQREKELKELARLRKKYGEI